MADWHDTANRALALLDDSDAAVRTKCMMTHILDEGHDDSFISDFFNVQQTAGGLPPNITTEQFIAMVSAHLREILGRDSFDGLSDSDFTDSILGSDGSIRQIIGFLNGVVHQAAPGEAHLALWKFILDSRSDPNSIYHCYADFLVDG